LNTTNRRLIARPVAGIFFPQRPLLKIGTHGYSPSVLNKIVQAAGQVKSHQVAAKVLGVVGEIAISGRHVNRLAEEIGTELKDQRDRQTCVATMQDCHEFGKRVAAEAHRRNFQAAPRGALLGDGSAWIWNQHEKWFSDLTAVVDFVHALTYLYVTATVLSSSVSERWQAYVQWMTLCWQGRVGEVIEDMEDQLGRLEPQGGPAKLPATDPREALRRTLGYLRNNQARMNYPAYRKQGLPTSSSMVESLIKEVNYRVKGTEKFWDNPAGAEAILQIRAAQLSDDDRLATYIADRPGHAFRRHPTCEFTQAA
jgi:hypothetical protein